MAGNRKAAEAAVYKWIAELIPGDDFNVKRYKTLFAQMSDAQFDAFMELLESGEEVLSFENPNLSEHKLTIENNFRVAQLLEHPFFERVWLTDPATGVRYLSPIPYLIVDLPLARQQQMLVEKMSIPENNRHVDELTGQPTGDSHSSSATFPEIQGLYAQGLNQVILELIKFRGGDTVARQRMDRSILETGGVRMDAVEALGPTRPKSTETLSTLLNGMHLSNTL
jgi:hypothetical protein